MNKPTLELQKIAFDKERSAVEQVLGVALGYPWYVDDPKNFPDATISDGVCVGEHVPGTIAKEAAKRIAKLESEVERLRNLLSDIVSQPLNRIEKTHLSGDLLLAIEKGREELEGDQ